MSHNKNQGRPFKCQLLILTQVTFSAHKGGPSPQTPKSLDAAEGSIGLAWDPMNQALVASQGILKGERPLHHPSLQKMSTAWSVTGLRPTKRVFNQYDRYV